MSSEADTLKRFLTIVEHARSGAYLKGYLFAVYESLQEHHEFSEILKMGYHERRENFTEGGCYLLEIIEDLELIARFGEDSIPWEEVKHRIDFTGGDE